MICIPRPRPQHGPDRPRTLALFHTLGPGASIGFVPHNGTPPLAGPAQLDASHFPLETSPDWLCFAEQRSFTAIGSRDAKCCVSTGCPGKAATDWLCSTELLPTPVGVAISQGRRCPPSTARDWLCSTVSQGRLHPSSTAVSWLCFAEPPTTIWVAAANAVCRWF